MSFHMVIPSATENSEDERILSSIDARIVKYEKLVQTNTDLLAKIQAEGDKTRLEEMNTQALFDRLLNLMQEVQSLLRRMEGIPTEIAQLMALVHQLIGQNYTYKDMAYKDDKDTKPTIDIQINNRQEVENAFEFLGTVAESDLLQRIESAGVDDVEALEKIQLPNSVLEVVTEVVGMVVPQAASVLKVGQMLAAFYKIRKGKPSE